MVKQLTDERRKAIRAKRILSIQFRLIKPKHKDADTRWHLSTTHDMSVLGLTFLSDVSYQVDDVLELHVVMSGILDIFKGHGKVLRVEKKETGAFYLIAVKFVDLKKTTKKTTKPKAARPSRKIKSNRIKRTARK